MVTMALPAARSSTVEEWQPPTALRFATAAFGALAAIAACALLALVGWRGLARSSGAVAAAPAATREFTLEAKEVDWELYPGTTVKAWTFNGTVPGPEIRVTEGDLVRVTLKNSLPAPTSIHWHGIDVPNNMDGVPGVTQDAVPPGGTFTYEFVATNPGTRWYHSHQDAEIQVPLGLFGAFIVEPKTPPQGAVQYDREFTYILSEWSLALTPDVATGDATLPLSGPGAAHSKEPDFDLFLMNGHAGEAIEPVTVKTGDRVRIRLINAGSLVHTMHTHGHSFKVIATDGNFIPPAQQLTKDSVTLGPSERVDIELLANNPGVWMFHCHIEHHMANGMMTFIRYEGAPAPAGAAMPAMPGMPGTTVSAAAPSAPVLSADDPAVAAAAVKITMTDNHYSSPTLTIPAGSSVAFINRGANLHTATSFDGLFESGSLAPGQAWVYTFTTPGTYRYFCRQHILNGMTGTITVT